jgi:dihydroorotate dehydrogenase (NAD+) catalytic subunit
LFNGNATDMHFTYDIAATYAENYEHGPQFASAPPDLPASPPKQFLGLPVRSRIGIAAGLLLNSRWIEGYARRGFDILTYKTVRSHHRPCYPLPNWVFVDDDGQADGPVWVTERPPDDPAQISSAVCFGMPSMAPEVWRADVTRAKASLGDGQILIVSVVATPSDQPTPEEVAGDFARCAAWAAEAGADVIEANFSCPNVCSAEGTIYHDADLCRTIAQRTREVIGGKPLLIKVGHFARADALRAFLRRMDGAISGVTLVNGISRPVLHRDGRPAFGEQYVTAGVLGRSIHAPSVENVRQAAECIREDGLNLAVAAVGGVSTTPDMADFFAAGADAVLLGSSPMYLPDLAADTKRAHPEW